MAVVCCLQGGLATFQITYTSSAASTGVPVAALQFASVVVAWQRTHWRGRCDLRREPSRCQPNYELPDGLGESHTVWGHFIAAD